MPFRLDTPDPERDMQERDPLPGCLLILLCLFLIWCAAIYGIYRLFASH